MKPMDLNLINFREPSQIQDGFHAHEPQALPQWTHWQGSHGQAEVGPRVQGGKRVGKLLYSLFKVFLVVLNLDTPPQGFLVSSDGYMNLQLANTEEYIDGSCTGNLGEVRVLNSIHLKQLVKRSF